MKIETILTTKGSNVFTVRTTQPVRDAVVLLVRHNIGAVVVLNDAGELRGILSERDVIRAVARDENLTVLTVGDLMTRQVIIGEPGDDATAVLHTMTEKRFRHLPVLDQGRLIGIVSIGDLVKLQLDEYQGEIETLKTMTNGE